MSGGRSAFRDEEGQLIAEMGQYDWGLLLVEKKEGIWKTQKYSKAPAIYIPVGRPENNMHYTIKGLGEEEYVQLLKEFDPRDYQSYQGPLSPWKVWDGLELLFYLGDKFAVRELTDYKKKYHPDCTESAPFLLQDGRVLLVNVSSAQLFKNEAAYLKTVQSWPMVK